MRRGGRPKAIKLIALPIALALATASCGSDDDESGGDTTPASQTAVTSEETTPEATTGDTATDATDAVTPGTTGETTAGTTGEATDVPIKIGLAIANSGVQANPDIGEVIQAWAEWTNDNGGVAGHPVEIVTRDSKSDPAAGQAATAELIEEGVSAMIFIDNVAEVAGADAITAAHIPVLGLGYNNDAFSVLPRWYSTTTTIPSVVTEQLLAPKLLGLGTFSAMSCAESPSCAQADLIYKPTAEGLGLRYGGLLTVAASAPNYTAECLSLMDAGMEYIQMSTATPVAIRIAEDCLRQGYTGVFGASAGTAAQSDLESVDGSKWAGGLHGFPWWADAAPAQEFRDVMGQYAPDTDFREPTMTGTWAMLQLFNKALTNLGPTGEVTADTVAEAYGTVKEETLDGLLPQPLTFSADEPAAEVDCFWPYSYTAGDQSPTLLSTGGDSGNGASGDLATACLPSS